MNFVFLKKKKKVIYKKEEKEDKRKNILCIIFPSLRWITRDE